MEQKRYTPSQAAKILGVAAWTMRRWMREGKVPAHKSDTGRWYVPATWVNQQSGELSPIHGKRCVIYARESSSENQAAMESQVQTLIQYAEARGYQIVRVIKEFGSGVNDNSHLVFRTALWSTTRQNQIAKSDSGPDRERQ